MELKNAIPMIIGLAVAVVLVAGLMIPVISSLGNSGGTGGGETHTTESNISDYFIHPDENTHLTLYKTYGNFDGGMTSVYSYEDLNENPDAERWRVNDAYQGLIGEYYYEQGDDILDYSKEYSENINIKWPIIIDGTTATVTATDDTVVTYDNLLLITAPQSMANYIAITNDDDTPAVAPYVGDSWICATVDDWTTSPELVIIGDGSSTDGINYTIWLDWNTPTEEYTDGQLVIEDGYLTGVTINYDGGSHTYSVTGPEDDYEIYYFVPIEVTESGSGGAGISSTMMSLISVIPLITVIGIIIGAIGYMRMKE